MYKCFTGGNIVASKKGLTDFDENVKKAGSAIGKLLARSQAKIEKAGRQALKTTGELVETMTKKTEETVESTVEKIHEATAPSNEESKNNAIPKFKPIKNKAINESVRFLGEDIINYLVDNGKTTMAEMEMVMGKRRRNPGMTFAAIGWLAGEDKVHITRNGENISLKQPLSF